MSECLKDCEQRVGCILISILSPLNLRMLMRVGASRMMGTVGPLGGPSQEPKEGGGGIGGLVENAERLVVSEFRFEPS